MKRGDRVKASGKWHNRKFHKWHKTYTGTILQRLTRHSYEVKWDNTIFSTQEMYDRDLTIINTERGE